MYNLKFDKEKNLYKKDFFQIWSERTKKAKKWHRTRSLCKTVSSIATSDLVLNELQTPAVWVQLWQMAPAAVALKSCSLMGQHGTRKESALHATFDRHRERDGEKGHRNKYLHFEGVARMEVGHLISLFTHFWAFFQWFHHNLCYVACFGFFKPKQATSVQRALVARVNWNYSLKVRQDFDYFAVWWDWRLTSHLPW